MKIDYNEICKIYDDVREEEQDIIKCFIGEADVDEKAAVLDIGCGTGNYANMLQRITGARVYGLDSSEGMLQKAMEKNTNITFKVGDAADIPFESSYFSFIYMTDVIHHIPDINAMFSEIYRVLKDGGKVCISTQSHKQIELRLMSEFFPGTATADKKRYPDIDAIIKAAESNGIVFVREQVIGEGDEIELGESFLDLIEKKGYSMFHLISEEEYIAGCEKVKSQMQNGPIRRKSAGGTLVWFQKRMNVEKVSLKEQMQIIFPEPILTLPEADIPLKGVHAYLSQGNSHQIIFMEFAEDVDLPEHSHAAQIGIVIEGKIELTVNGVKNIYCKGDMYYIPADVKHSGRIYAGYADMTFFNQRDRYLEKLK